MPPFRSPVDTRTRPPAASGPSAAAAAVVATPAGSLATAPSIEEVLREHGAMLARIAGSYEREPARRQDLLQEISLSLWKAMPRFRGESSVRTFVARIAHYRAVDHLSRAQRQREDELDERLPDPGADPFGTAEVDQRRQDLLGAVRRLPLGQRQVVVLALEGFSLRETGEALGLEENTVAKRLSRSRRQLREWLGEPA